MTRSEELFGRAAPEAVEYEARIARRSAVATVVVIRRAEEGWLAHAVAEHLLWETNGAEAIGQKARVAGELAVSVVEGPLLAIERWIAHAVAQENLG